MNKHLYEPSIIAKQNKKPDSSCLKCGLPKSNEIHNEVTT